MRRAMIAGLTSVQSEWRDALARIEFQGPDAAFVDRLVGNIALPISHHVVASTLYFSLSGALQFFVTGEGADLADRLLGAMCEHSERIAAEVIADPGDPILFRTDALVWLAAARSMSAAAAPDRALLTLAAEATLARFTAFGKRKNIHVAGLFQLQFAAYAALLSGNLALFRQVMSLRASIAVLPRQWSLLQSIAARAQQSEHAGASIIRCADAHVHAQFMALFQLHRFPSNQHVEAELGREGLLAGGQLGGYVYAWIYLQSFGPLAVVRSDWNVLRDLLTG